jgi:hypothetical protein
MRLARSISAFVVTLSIISPVHAQEQSVTVFPPLYRELARDTAAIRPQSELTTTPQLVPADQQPAAFAQRSGVPQEPERTGALD